MEKGVSLERNDLVEEVFELEVLDVDFVVVFDALFAAGALEADLPAVVPLLEQADPGAA